MKKARRIGLALGGGGARGLAHIGVMKVLERENIKPDLIVGTSIGSIVGGALASGITAHELEKRVEAFLKSDLYTSSQLKAMGNAESGGEQRLSRRIQSYFRTKIRLAHALYKPSILELGAVEEFISYFVPDIQIEETLIPFRAVATDLETGGCVVLSEGSLRRSILASSAVPGVLPPVAINGRRLSDGGIICTVPARYAWQEGIQAVIAVAIDRDIVLSSDLETAVDIYVRAGEIMGFHLEKYELENADLIIRPELGGIHWTNFSQSKQLIASGEEAALKSLPEIRRLIKPRRAVIDRIKGSFKRFFAIQPSGNG
jgi:NTE family protein